MVNTEMLVKLHRLGIPTSKCRSTTIHGSMALRAAQAPRVIARAFGELLKLHTKLRTWTATVPPEE